MASLTPTRGESLLIWRRREGLHQIKAAKAFEVSADKYREWEADRSPGDQPRMHIGQLKLHELCLLRRRRKGMTQREVAVKMGCTRLWVIQMENGEAPIDRLLEFWRE